MAANRTDSNADMKTPSFAGDVIAARIAPVILAAMALLLWILTATGAFASVRNALGESEGQTDEAFYELAVSYDADMWNDCFSGPLEAFMPAAITPPVKATDAAPEEDVSGE